MLAPSAPSHTTTVQPACRAMVCRRGVAVIEGEVAERLHGDDDLDRAVIGLPDGERQLLPGRLGIVALEHAQLAALAGGAHALDAAQLLDARGVERDGDGGRDEQRDARLLRAVGVEDGDRVAGDDFTLEVEGASQFSPSVSRSTA